VTRHLGWGIVGTGAISSLFAADVKRVEGNHVVAVCSRFSRRAVEFAETNDVPTSYGDYSDFLRNPRVDVVYIATPAGTHRRLAEMALLTGRHVVVEKPMALTANDVRDLAKTARKRGVFLMEAMWMKFSPAFRDVLAIIASGRIGEPRSVQAAFGVPFPREQGNRWNAESGGSALLDQGIYNVTLARAVFGDPDHVSASGSDFAPEVDQTEWITLGFPGGRFAQLASSMVEWIAPRAAINGTGGYLTMDAPFWAASSVSIHGGASEKAFFEPEVRRYDIQGNGFVPMISSIATEIDAGRTEHRDHDLQETARAFDLLDEIRHLMRQPGDIGFR
jgi:predicted dehydrogenase